MTRRTIEISSFDSRLNVRYGQVRLTRDDELVSQFPADEIGLLISDARIATFSSDALVQIVEKGGVVVCCGNDHLPAAMVVPLAGHYLHYQRLQLQLEMSKPTGKRLWQDVVKGKIHNQATACNCPKTAARLKSYAGRVKSGDPDNVEAQAARLYWSVYLGDEKFKRDREGAPPNLFLNYGYMVLRAAMARSIYAFGLNPAFGIHHASRSNAFCLADDLMEPFRPWVDVEAARLYNDGKRKLTKEAKARLLQLLYEPCVVGEYASNLQQAADHTARSLLQRLNGKSQPLLLPRMIDIGESLPGKSMDEMQWEDDETDEVIRG